MVNKFETPMFKPQEAARYLRMPESTMRRWLHGSSQVGVLVHSVAPECHGWPSIPFVGLIEAYVLRNLRELGLSTRSIQETAVAVRREFGTPYALATKKIATDGIDIFIQYAGQDDLARARDGQRPIRDVVGDYLRYIEWDPQDEFAGSLRLPQFPRSNPVIIDPNFAFGQPVLASKKIPVEAIVDLWKAGEPMEAVAEEYELDVEAVEDLCRAAVA